MRFTGDQERGVLVEARLIVELKAVAGLAHWQQKSVDPAFPGTPALQVSVESA
jgi:hypothetical protein